MHYYKIKISLFFSLVFLIACQNNSPSPTEKTSKQVVEVKIDKAQIAEEGATIVGQSFAELSSHLQHQIKTNGIENAISFCNLNANPIVDSLSQYYQVGIKRTSLQLRNEANKANQIELEVLNQFQSDFNLGNDIENQVYSENGETYFFAPIYVMDACTKCHGKANESLNELAYNKIMELYPNDKAIGYSAGDLRGIWSVKF